MALKQSHWEVCTQYGWRLSYGCGDRTRSQVLPTLWSPSPSLRTHAIRAGLHSTSREESLDTLDTLLRVLWPSPPFLLAREGQVCWLIFHKWVHSCRWRQPGSENSPHKAANWNVSRKCYHPGLLAERSLRCNNVDIIFLSWSGMLRSAWVCLQRLLTREPLYCNTCQRGTDPGLDMHGNYGERSSCQVIYACWSLMLLCPIYSNWGCSYGEYCLPRTHGGLIGDLWVTLPIYKAPCCYKVVKWGNECKSLSAMVPDIVYSFFLQGLFRYIPSTQEGKSIICKTVNNFIVAFFWWWSVQLT